MHAIDYGKGHLLDISETPDSKQEIWFCKNRKCIIQ